MTILSSLRVRLVGTVLLAIAPALVLVLLIPDVPWTGFLVGLMALGAAWFGGERFILRQVKALAATTNRFAAGDLKSRTSLDTEPGEIGQLARSFDAMAASLEQQINKREAAELALLIRAHQQTVLAAVGQFALVTTDLSELLNQTVIFVTQTLEVEYCGVFELLPDGKTLILRAGAGWKEGYVGRATIDAEPGSQVGHTFVAREPVVVTDMRQETRFAPSPLLVEHGVVSGVNVVIAGDVFPFGVLAAHSLRKRNFTEEEIHFLQALAHVLATALERKRTEAEVQKMAAFAQFNPNPVLEFSAEGDLTYFNEAALTLASRLGHEHPKHVLPPDVVATVRHCLATNRPKLNLETRPASRILSWSFFPVTASQVVHCYVEDVTDRQSLESQLRQAQKMQSIGQLAAGVAHDFNNMLTVIQGHTGMLLARPNLSPEMLDSLQAVYFAAERAASLTRQLLLFSRRNVMQPRLLDLRAVVGDMSKMLKRLMGETITLEFNPPNALPSIQGDAGMLEQVIMNLAVNARDAMLNGGTLTINAFLVEIADDYVQMHPEARPGLSVCLRVTDTGCGMDAATQSRIFEPFFTTKEVGKGTGLGLATVYGIVKQHEGWIEVASEVGKGTTFSLFFPASTELAAKPAERTLPTAEVRGGHETILVVEDEPVLRDLAQLILQEHGYYILTAASGVEALVVWEKHQGTIDLLLTDVVMPEGISGKELADRLLVQQPKLKVLFTSGYTVEELVKDGTRFLQKPYSRYSLAQAVRECLDAGRR